MNSDRQADVSLERHYTVKQIAELWSVSDDIVRRSFAGVPGVLRFGRPETRFKRAYESIRVPESVMVSVHRSMRGE